MSVPTPRQLRIAARLRLELRRRARYDQFDEDGRAAWRAARLEALRRRTLARSPGYRRLHQGLEGAPLDELPIITKDDVVDRFDELVTDPDLRLDVLRRGVEADVPGRIAGYRVSATSGSSGRPGLFPFDDQEWVGLLAAAARGRMLAGAPPAPTNTPRMRTARIGSPSPWHLSTQLPATLADPRKPALVLSAATDTGELHHPLHEWQPHVLSGYPSVLGTLAEDQLAGRLDISPQRVFTGGERLAPAIRDRIEAAWGIQPFDQYATSEAGFLAVDCDRHEGLHVLDDHVLVEVVDRDGRAVPAGVDGDRVLITVLGSRTLPLIRYELGDVAALADGPCPCGRRSPRLRGLTSGSRSLLRLPGPGGGEVTVHPVLFTAVLDPAPVRGWQVVVDRDRVRVLLAGAAPGIDADGLARTLAGALRTAGVADLPVEVTPVDSLQRAASGKAGLVLRAGDAGVA